MFQWINKLFDEPRDPWWVSLDHRVITVHDPLAKKRSEHLDHIKTIIVETNDKGPLENDIWWILYGRAKEPLCFPQGIIGDHIVIDELTNFPGFNHAKMASAMASFQNKRFTLWGDDKILPTIEVRKNLHIKTNKFSYNTTT